MATPTIPLDDALLFFGGPYSNLAATEAMREEATRLGISRHRTVCTGDLVAYCAEPRETVDLIRDWGIQVVMGNCEESLAAGSSDCGCGFEEGSACALLSDAWFPYASRLINQAQRQWMSQLPRSIHLTIGEWRVQVVHGSPSSINQFVFASTSRAEKCAALADAEDDCEILVAGHCGIPFGEQIDGQYWLNSGVIGMPANDGTADGWYLLLYPTTEGLEACWRRLSYDWKRTVAVMTSRGLLGGYREALQTGCWPSMDILPTRERQQRGLPLSPRTLPIRHTRGAFKTTA